MKKLIAVLMVLAMMLSTAAFAGEVNWEDVAESAAVIPGDFYAVSDLGIVMWIPDVMEAFENDVESGIAALKTPDDSNFLLVNYADLNGMDLEAWVEAAKTVDTLQDVSLETVNGLPCATFRDLEKDAACAMLATDAGYGIIFTITPASDEDWFQVAMWMIASIQLGE